MNQFLLTEMKNDWEMLVKILVDLQKTVADITQESDADIRHTVVSNIIYKKHKIEISKVF